MDAPGFGTYGPACYPYQLDPSAGAAKPRLTWWRTASVMPGLSPPLHAATATTACCWLESRPTATSRPVLSGCVTRPCCFTDQRLQARPTTSHRLSVPIAEYPGTADARTRYRSGAMASWWSSSANAPRCSVTSRAGTRRRHVQRLNLVSSRPVCFNLDTAGRNPLEQETGETR